MSIVLNNTYNVIEGVTKKLLKLIYVENRITFSSVLSASSRLLSVGIDPPSITPIRFFIRTRIWNSWATSWLTWHYSCVFLEVRKYSISIETTASKVTMTKQVKIWKKIYSSYLLLCFPWILSNSFPPNRGFCQQFWLFPFLWN